ncbi:hypothetical protein APSETT444_004598 [Aspergillus pseudonomiae]
MIYATNSLHDDVLKAYFNESDKEKALGIFKTVLRYSQTQAADSLGNYFVTAVDTNNKCKGRTFPYTRMQRDIGTKMIHFCDSSFKRPLIKDVKCENLVVRDIQTTQVLRNTVRLSCTRNNKEVLTLRQDPCKGQLRRSNTLRLSSLTNSVHEGQVRLKIVVTESRHSTAQITTFGKTFLQP